MQARPIPRHRDVAIAAARGEELQKRSRDVRHVARKHQGSIRRGAHQCGVEPAECANARQPIRYDLHAAANVALGAANDDDPGGTAVERGQLAIEDASIAHDERALVLATQAAGLPASEDVRVPEHAGDRLRLFNLPEMQRMRDGGIGRVLVAALHQGIVDLLPERQEFYENWFSPAGLRSGRVGLAPLTAVLSFLRREGDAYTQITGRAGEYAADWIVDALPPLRRAIVRALPRQLRVRLALGVARDLVRQTYGGSRAIVRMRRAGATVDIRSSIFCGVREPAPAPLCHFYKAAFARVLARFALPAAIEVTSCRGMGLAGCVLDITLTATQSAVAEPAMMPVRASEASA
jgi:bacteriochlorophyll 4-vinyl reductase